MHPGFMSLFAGPLLSPCVQSLMPARSIVVVELCCGEKMETEGCLWVHGCADLSTPGPPRLPLFSLHPAAPKTAPKTTKYSPYHQRILFIAKTRLKDDQRTVCTTSSQTTPRCHPGDGQYLDVFFFTTTTGSQKEHQALF
ncbi:hypothetical protein HDK90DRAFT_129972 [Phyllosticta capitalensis]|uniref:Secreted protein n=1 Tax=Phyllosticta capitalensis TaxID=121624 RepID=A0ABR1YYA1_9PEZI